MNANKDSTSSQIELAGHGKSFGIVRTESFR